MSVRAVFFDVDDTLIDYQHAARTAFQHALGADADYDAFSALDHHMLFDDALARLAALRERDIRIALITNNEGTHQRAKTAAVGLDRLVDIAVISGDLGFPKPDPNIFAHACAALDIRPADALHVGDNIDADAHRAHAAGLTAVIELVD